MSVRPFRVGRAAAGLGLFATDEIRKGASIVAYTGRRIPDAEAAKREARGARYIFEINSRWAIDGSSRRNIARYVNHSCRPNAEAVHRRRYRVVYVARRRIRPDEEITVDYGKEYFDGFIKDSGCRCAACHDKRRAGKRKRKHKAKNRVRRSKRAR